MPIYRVSALQTQFAQLTMNVYHYDSTGVIAPAAIVEIADDIRAKYISTALRASLSAGWQFDAVEVRRVDLADQPSITAAPASGVLVGTSAADPLPSQIAMLVSGTALTTFPRRVRTYLGGITEGSLTAGLFSTGIAAVGLAFVEALDTITITGDTLDRVAVRYAPSEDGPVVEAFNQVATYSVTRVPATQRRRRIGVGS